MFTKFKIFFTFILFSVFLLSCIGRIPVQHRSEDFCENDPKAFEKGYDQVWDATERAAEELDWDIKWADKPTGTIKFEPSYVYFSSFGGYQRVYHEPKNEELLSNKLGYYLTKISYFEKVTPRQAQPHPRYTKENLTLHVDSKGSDKTEVKARYRITPFFDPKIGQLGRVRSNCTYEKAFYARINELLSQEKITPPIPPPPPPEEIYELSDIFFDFDMSFIRPDAVPVLVQNAQTLRDNPELNVVIQGYADIRGTNEYNIRLGKRRAEATKRYLSDLGINPKRIISLSEGETIKFAPGTTEDEFQLNRRSHFVPVSPEAPVIYPE